MDEIFPPDHDQGGQAYGHDGAAETEAAHRPSPNPGYVVTQLDPHALSP
jgi:hypothetical protein